MEIVPVHPDDAAFAQWLAVIDAAHRERWGDVPGWQPAELRGMALDTAGYEEMHPLAAVEDGAVRGAAWVWLYNADNRHLAWMALSVHPEHRRRGVGTALLAGVEDFARARGRTTVGVWHDELPGEVGRSAGRAFAEHHGYQQAQSNIRRSLAVPAPPERMAALAAEVAPFTAGYRAETFVGPWPDEWVPARLEFGRRMSTDAPLGEVDREEERWDAGRLRAVERSFEAQERDHLVAVMVEESTGDPVAFSEIAVPRGAPSLAYQHDTLVLPEHRGHRLGTAVKLANLEQLARYSPATTSVVTYNAADNAHMIAVNEALGCVVTAQSGNWQKKLD